MTTRDKTETLWALSVLRRYAPDPLAESDEEYRRFQRQCARDEAFREKQEEGREIDPRSDEQWFLDEQCPSDSNFR
jgi:hypothetical protein